ncbi:MAG: DUF5318 family protein [Acidimicrobiia bacterium]|nr:DUF5318 family protein [Acidimicrobiia bacterium]
MIYRIDISRKHRRLPPPPAPTPRGRRYTPHVRRHTDYVLARRAALRDYRRGALTQADVCDAHPELLRAARHVGEEAAQACPICGHRTLRYVSYVYGDALKSANGRCVSGSNELERLGARFDEFARYVVEVCLDCSWNHLGRRELHGRRHAG